jgi:multidrug resistance protein MdtO
VLYNALAWPGISTAVTTCLLTALSTIGSSRQKQVLRIAGAAVGGFVIGMGSQIFILPQVDSIGGFLVLFGLVTAVSSWLMTSSPRLSYFGVQFALAFYFIHLQEFTIQTSLSIARDRVVGILLGLIMMWLVFDQLWGARAAVEMKRTFILNLRLVAQFARQPDLNDPRIAVARSLALRETINANLDKVRALADGVLFEFGPSRRRDLELRSCIREWQPQLRTLFVMRNTSLKYRLQLPGFELPESVRLLQQAYDERSARILEEMADQVGGREHSDADQGEQSVATRKEALRNTELEARRELPPAQAQSFVTLLEAIDVLTTSLGGEIEKDFAL